MARFDTDGDDDVQDDGASSPVPPSSPPPPDADGAGGLCWAKKAKKKDVDDAPPSSSDVVFVIPPGMIVDVASRTWSGANKPGGVAKILKSNGDGTTVGLTYDVKYVLGGREKAVPAEYVALQGSVTVDEAKRSSLEETTTRRRTTRRSRGFDGASEKGGVGSASSRSMTTARAKDDAKKMNANHAAKRNGKGGNASAEASSSKGTSSKRPGTKKKSAVEASSAKDPKAKRPAKKKSTSTSTNKKSKAAVTATVVNEISNDGHRRIGAMDPEEERAGGTKGDVKGKGDNSGAGADILAKCGTTGGASANVGPKVKATRPVAKKKKLSLASTPTKGKPSTTKTTTVEDFPDTVDNRGKREASSDAVVAAKRTAEGSVETVSTSTSMLRPQSSGFSTDLPPHVLHAKECMADIEGTPVIGSEMTATPVQKDDDWPNAKEKIKCSGWRFVKGSKLVEYYYVLPGGKMPSDKKSVSGVDYLESEFDMKNFAHEHFGWGGDELFRKERKEMDLLDRGRRNRKRSRVDAKKPAPPVDESVSEDRKAMNKDDTSRLECRPQKKKQARTAAAKKVQKSPPKSKAKSTSTSKGKGKGSSKRKRRSSEQPMVSVVAVPDESPISHQEEVERSDVASAAAAVSSSPKRSKGMKKRKECTETTTVPKKEGKAKILASSERREAKSGAKKKKRKKKTKEGVSQRRKTRLKNVSDESTPKLNEATPPPAEVASSLKVRRSGRERKKPSKMEEFESDFFEEAKVDEDKDKEYVGGQESEEEEGSEAGKTGQRRDATTKEGQVETMTTSGTPKKKKRQQRARAKSTEENKLKKYGPVSERTCPKCKKVFSIVTGLAYHLAYRVCERTKVYQTTRCPDQKMIPFFVLQPGEMYETPHGIVKVLADDRVPPDHGRTVVGDAERKAAFHRTRRLEGASKSRMGRVRHSMKMLRKRRERLKRAYLKSDLRNTDRSRRGTMDKEEIWDAYYHADPPSFEQAYDKVVKRKLPGKTIEQTLRDMADPLEPADSYPDRIVECEWIQDERQRITRLDESELRSVSKVGRAKDIVRQVHEEVDGKGTMATWDDVNERETPRSPPPAAAETDEAAKEEQKWLGKMYVPRRMLVKRYSPANPLYVCKLCGRRFHSRSGFKYHVEAASCAEPSQMVLSEREKWLQFLEDGLEESVDLAEVRRKEWKDQVEKRCRAARKALMKKIWNKCFYPQVFVALGFVTEVPVNATTQRARIRRLVYGPECKSPPEKKHKPDHRHQPGERQKKRQKVMMEGAKNDSCITTVSSHFSTTYSALSAYPGVYDALGFRTRKFEEKPTPKQKRIRRKDCLDPSTVNRIKLQFSSMYPKVYDALQFKTKPKQPPRKTNLLAVKRRRRRRSNKPLPPVKPKPPPRTVDIAVLVEEIDSGRYPSMNRFHGQHMTNCVLCKKDDEMEMLQCTFCQRVEHVLCFRTKFTMDYPPGLEDDMCHWCIQYVLCRRARAEKRRREKAAAALGKAGVSADGAAVLAGTAADANGVDTIHPTVAAPPVNPAAVAPRAAKERAERTRQEFEAHTPSYSSCPQGGPGGLICCETCSAAYSRRLTGALQGVEIHGVAQAGRDICQLLELLRDAKGRLEFAINAAKLNDMRRDMLGSGKFDLLSVEEQDSTTLDHTFVGAPTVSAGTCEVAGMDTEVGYT